MQDHKLTEDFSIFAEPGAYHRFGYETDGKKICLFLDGVLQKEIMIPSSPSFASVVCDTGDEVIIKAVNLSSEPDMIQISLDCEVKSGYTVNVLTGAKDAQNSFEEPEKVHDITVQSQGAAAEFSYEAPPYSVNVLRLKKKCK